MVMESLYIVPLYRIILKLASELTNLHLELPVCQMACLQFGLYSTQEYIEYGSVVRPEFMICRQW